MLEFFSTKKSEFFQEASDAASSAMVSIIGLDSEKVQQLCDAANEDVDEANKVQIANYLCPVRFCWISVTGQAIYLAFSCGSMSSSNLPVLCREIMLSLVE